jgi:predicted ATPase with chaperone activity
MKYSEYLQLRDILDENGISWEDYQKDPKLYEGVLSSLGKGLMNLAKKGMQFAVSKGISGKRKNELNKAAEEIRNWILQEIETAGEDSKHPLYDTMKKKEEAKKISGGKGEKAKIAKRVVQSYDRQIAQFIRKKVDLKTKNIEKKIQKNSILTDNDKEALSEYWDDLSINLEVAITQALSDAKIVEEDTVEDWFKKIRGEVSMRNREKTSSSKKPKVKSEETPSETSAATTGTTK